MKMPMLLTAGHRVEPDKKLEDGEPFISHVRVGPMALTVDVHVPNEAAADGEDVYAVLIPLAALYQLFEVADEFLGGASQADMGQPSAGKELLN